MYKVFGLFGCASAVRTDEATQAYWKVCQEFFWKNIRAISRMKAESDESEYCGPVTVPM